jgi:hypothetical protein
MEFQTKNPLLSGFMTMHGITTEDEATQAWLDRKLHAPAVGYFEETKRLQSTYAWSIPTERALTTIAQHAPIIEVFAGTGYWARLLADRGVDIVAYDARPIKPDHTNEYFNEDAESWFPVKRGTQRSVIRHADRALLMVWPPYASPIAAEALALYKGSTLIYVGEPEGGCTADDRFFEQLQAEWNGVECITMPQFDGIHDYLLVYTRRATDRVGALEL